MSAPAENLQELLGEAIAAEASVEAREYLRKTKRFYHLLERGIDPGEWIVLERDLVEVAQIPSGSNRRDLAAEMEALEAEAECRFIVEAATAAEFEVEEVERRGGVVVEHGEEGSIVEIVVEGQRAWPEPLGGAGLRGEIERRITLHVRRAPWRDRRVRRLAKLTVVAVEIHPDPERSAL